MNLSSYLKMNPKLFFRTLLLMSMIAVGADLLHDQSSNPSEFKRIPTQFIAALGDPKANSGAGAEKWGVWRIDPGPRGVWLKNYDDQLVSSGGKAPDGWKFDPNDWWLEENGLIMEAPDFPLPSGRYLVTGGRSTTAVLKVDAPNSQGVQNWNLEHKKSTLYDVTHLPCRSARYTPNDLLGSPATADLSLFPVKPGAEMPPVRGCDKQDYAVLFLIGMEAPTSEL